MSLFLYRPGHPKANERGIVSADDLGSWDDGNGKAFHANVMVDRYMEGAKAPDGTDIGSRAKRRAWMKATGMADGGDYSDGFRERLKKSEEREHTEGLRKDIHEAAQQLESGRRPYRQENGEWDGRAATIFRKD